LIARQEAASQKTTVKRAQGIKTGNTILSQNQKRAPG
jgi:hypothetical protein